jgi:hypothetical protein
MRVDEQVGLFWIDSDRVLYRGFADNVLQKIATGTLTDKELFQSPRVVRSFNPRTGAIRDHAISQDGGLCFSNGNILYKKRDKADTPPYYVFGPLDAEQKPSELTVDVERRGISSFIRCYNPDVSHLPKWPSEIVPLLEEHGFVELRRKQPGQEENTEPEIFLYRPGSSTAVAIEGFKTANAQNLSWRSPIFAPWKGAYFIYTVGVRGSVPNSGWWLYPSGKTEKVDLPFGAWNDFTRTNAQFYPTRCGLLINITYRVGELVFLKLKESPLTSQPKFRDPERISPGRVWGLAVSPDGLKVAIVVGATKIPSTNPSVLRVIDLCPG